MRRLLVVVTLSLLALGSAFEINKPQPTPNEASFIAGIVRSDGTLVPFAQYGNGGWFNPWPNPREPGESIYAESTQLMPHSLGLAEPWFMQSGMLPKTWYFWTSAQTPTVLNASRLVQVDNHSQNNWALVTDLSKQNANDGNHHRNIGVALTANHKIEPLVEIKPESVEAATLVSAIKDLFDKAETEELNKIPGESPLFPRSAEARAKVKMSITQLVRSRSSRDGTHLYYFEAEKKYEKLTTANDPTCDGVSLFQGWVEATARDGFGLLDQRVFLTDCDRKGPGSATLLGTMTLKNKVFLFVSEHGWEDESYIILELSSTGLHKVLETFGG